MNFAQNLGHSHSHAEDLALGLDPYLVSLNVLQISGLFHQVLMHLLTEFSGLLLPIGHRAFIQLEGGDNGL